MKTTHYFIERCLALGKQAAEKGNSAVGALIVKEDSIVHVIKIVTRDRERREDTYQSRRFMQLD